MAHTSDGSLASNIKEREKMPLENAVYYFYGGGWRVTRDGRQYAHDSKIARVR